MRGFDGRSALGDDFRNTYELVGDDLAADVDAPIALGLLLPDLWAGVALTLALFDADGAACDF